MSSLDELPLSTSAYLADTTHLSLPQHGAYLLILMAMWRACGWLADDERVLANICKVSIKQWRGIAPAIRALLLARDGRVSQKRLLADVGIALRKIAKCRAAGAEGGRAKALKTKEPALANATVSPAVRQPRARNGAESLFPSSASSPVDSEIQKTRNRENKNRGSPLPADWKANATTMTVGRRLGFSADVIADHLEDMRLWARANEHRPVARKLDWDAAAQGWLRRARQREPSSNQPRPSGNGAAAFVLNLMKEEADAADADAHQDRRPRAAEAGPGTLDLPARGRHP